MAEPKVVSLSLNDLEAGSDSCYKLLASAFGPGGMGLLTVSGIPEISGLRSALLPLAVRLAQLSHSQQVALEDPDSLWSFGWSRGRERLEGGRPDLAKGSFYANPVHDVPTADPDLIRRFPSYCRPNIWPEGPIPGLREAFRAACAAIMSAGQLLARRCDEYVRQALSDTVGQGAASAAASMEKAIADSPCCKARLLHYYPPSTAREEDGGEGPAADQPWCTIHTDHGALTGLMSAMYVRAAPDGFLEEVPSPDPAAGLYVRLRDGTDRQVSIPGDHVAYQLGEVMQLLSGGLLRATPHYVRSPSAASTSDPSAPCPSRNTLAVFMQPHWDLELSVPGGREGEAAGMMGGRWEPGISFGEFSDRTFRAYNGAY